MLFSINGREVVHIMRDDDIMLEKMLSVLRYQHRAFCPIQISHVVQYVHRNAAMDTENDRVKRVTQYWAV